MNSIREQFSILNHKVPTKNLVYLDNAATTQKPKSVIDAISDFYLNSNSNIHRGTHYLANKATELYEDVRQKMALFINANPKEINFTKGTTESINLLAYAWGYKI